MNHPFQRFVAFIALVAAFFAVAPVAHADALPADKFIKTMSDDILGYAVANKQTLTSDPKKLQAFVTSKILPNVNFNRMAQAFVGPAWREATPEQKAKIVEEFKTLLIRTYSGAIAQVKDERIEVLPLKGKSDDTEQVVQTQIIRSKGDPIQLDYRVEKSADGWKIYDVNVLGLWLVATYRSQYAQVVSKDGVEGLIKTLSEQNRAGDKSRG